MNSGLLAGLKTPGLVSGQVLSERAEGCLKAANYKSAPDTIYGIDRMGEEGAKSALKFPVSKPHLFNELVPSLALAGPGGMIAFACLLFD